MNFTISKKALIIYGILFALAILIGIIVGCNAGEAVVGFYTTTAIATLGVFPFVKKAVLWLGRKVVDLSTTIDVVVIVTILYSGIDSWRAPYWIYLAAAVLYLIFAVVKSYFLYLIIDIRDSVKK